MSLDGIIFEFFDLAMTKDILKIKQDDDSDDQFLSGTIGIKAERWVKNRLFPFAESFPLSTENQESAISAACSFAAARYKKHNNNLESAKSFMEDAKEELNSLVTLLKASHTPRTRIVARSQNYDTEDDTLFSQRII